MSENEPKEEVKLTLKIPRIRAESETQTEGQLVLKSPEIEISTPEMEPDNQTMSIRKRRNLSKNRGQAARQREKTPEPGRTPHEDTPTSEDEDFKPMRNSREIEADNTYEEMKRLVVQKQFVKDPVYDLNTDEVLEARAVAAQDRRRRSISPFALPDKEEIACALQRKGSFIDPTNKLLSTNYALSPKDEDNSRRNSLTLDTKSLSTPPTPATNSPKESNFPYPLPGTPKKLSEVVYPDEKPTEEPTKNLKTPVKKEPESVFSFDEKSVKPIAKALTPKPETPVSPPTGEIVTKVIQVERTPSKKLLAEKKPVVEVRERIVRTPSRKLSADVKPTVIKQLNPKKEETQSRVPPVKPARSKSASRFASKTSESEMSEDQHNVKAEATKRRTTAVPRRYVKNKSSPKNNRSQSVHRVEDLKVIDKTGTGMSQTSREILELMQKARARSLSIPKDDIRLPPEYKDYKKLKTPNKTPTTIRQNRGLSCPKTIQIISESEILSSLAKSQKTNLEKRSRHSSGYIDASQSEYTSSCYSSTPSENEYDFDLSERTAELTRKLNVLSQEVDKREMLSNILFDQEEIDKPVTAATESKSVLRKRSIADPKISAKKDSAKDPTIGPVADKKGKKKSVDDNSKLIRSRWKFLANWRQFKHEHRVHCEKIRSLRNRCISDLLILIIMCGLGGMMFKTLEGSFENAYKCSTRNVKRDFIEHLWRGSHHLREEDWKSMARKKLHEFEDQLHTAHEAGVTSYSGQRSWNFMNSFVYCFTLVTTVGYGHIAPKTSYGRIATIVYAIIGIPLFLILLADFGKLFTRIIKFFWAFIRRFYYTRSCRKVRRTAPVQEVMKGLNMVYDVVRRPSQIFSEEDVQDSPDCENPPVIDRKSSDVPPPLPPKPGTLPRDLDITSEPETPAPSVFEIDDEFNLPISVAVVILLIYINAGALVYFCMEQWTFFESFYFIFISITTIGLGDLVPDHPMFMMASILYLVFGFALTSMFINVVQEKLSDTFKQASAKLGATIGLKVADEDGSLVPITPPPTEIVPVHKTKNEIDEGKSKESKELDDETNNR